MSVAFAIRRDEVLSVRSAARNLYAILDRLDSGEAEKFVLLDQKNDLRAVLLTTDEYAALAAHVQPRRPDYEVFYEWCAENAPPAVETCPYKFPSPPPPQRKT